MIKSKQRISILLLSGSLLIASPASASSGTETAGDILAFAIPAVAYGSTYYVKDENGIDDKDGRRQFYQSFGANLATTYALKKSVHKERPDGSDNDAFPSGHTSLAFQGASFIHQRYGFEYSIPAYIGASFVGYSRIEADKHDLTDVLTGAALGVTSSMLFTKRYDNDVMIAANLSPDYYGLTLHYEY